jgi:hypothetical protein
MNYRSGQVARVRELTKAEIALVAGGSDNEEEEVVIISKMQEIEQGGGGGFDYYDQTWTIFCEFVTNNPGETSGSGGTPQGDGNGMTPSQTQDAIEVVDTLRAMLQQIAEDNMFTKIDVQGHVWPVWKLLEELGKLSEILSAGTLLWKLETGEAGLPEVIGFIAAVAAMGAMTEAAVPVLGVALLGLAVEKLITAGVIQIGIQFETGTRYFQEEVQRYIEANPAPPINVLDYQNWIRTIFGMPNTPGGGGDPNDPWNLEPIGP